jgi:short-subunit dehydrogenase
MSNNSDKKERRLIINVSSLAAELPISYFTVYNAAKLYVDRLTTICALEYPEIDFMSLRPSEVSTKMTGFKKDIFTI